MGSKRRIIVVTDGDKRAQEAVERAGKNLHLRTISASAGNPTPLMGEELLLLIQQAKHDPVLVMVDDCGNPATGYGEQALEYLANHSDIEILGVVAVAANAEEVDGVKVDFSVSRDCKIVDGPVLKDGQPEALGHLYVEGDTVDILNDIDVPLIVGIGDIGKMDGRDSQATGCAITTRAIQEILNRSGV